MSASEAEQKPVVFYCNVCGARAAQPILCTKDNCPTELTVNYAVKGRR